MLVDRRPLPARFLILGSASGALWRQSPEIDLLHRRKSKLYGVECKHVDALRLAPSIRNALVDFGLERVAIVHSGARRYALAEHVDQRVPKKLLVENGAPTA